MSHPLDPRNRANIIPAATKCPETGKPLCRWCRQPVPKGRKTWCSQQCVDDALIRCQPSYARRKVEERDKGVCAKCSRDTAKIENTLRRLGNVARDGILAYDRTLVRASKRYHVAKDRIWKILNSVLMPDIQKRQAKIDQRIAEGLPPGRIDPYLQNDILRAIEVTPEELRIRDVHKRMTRLFRARLNRFANELIREGFDGICARTGRVNRSMWDADHIVPVVKGGGGCGLENYRTLCQPCHKGETAALAAARAAERKGPNPQQEFDL